MAKTEQSIVIKRPVEEVFAYMSDARNNPQWQSGLVEIRQTPESPVGLGTQITQVYKFLGRKMESNSEVVEFEPNKKYTAKSTSSPFPIEGTHSFEPVAEGTKVTATLELKTGGFYALAEPLVAASLNRGMAANLGDLKDLLENQVVGISA